MKSYDMPPAANEDEKIIGGLLTFKQFGWLLGFFGLGMLSFVGLYVLTRIMFISVVLGIAIFSICIPFAFVKKYNMSFYKYLKIKKTYNKQAKCFINYKI